MLRREGHFSGNDNSDLFFQSWLPDSPRGSIIITHGYGEHSEGYNWLATQFVNNGYAVYAWDLRGHGRSSGPRGYVAQISDYFSDLEAFLTHLKNHQRLQFPTILFSHSMGGLVQLNFLAEKNTFDIQACIFSAPLMGLALHVPWVKDKAARILSRFLPRVTLKSDLQYEDLTRDVERTAWYYRDPLRHDKTSPQLYLGILDRNERAEELAKKIQIPCLFQLAGNDKIVSTPDAERVFAKISSNDKSILIYENNLHEIYNDLEKERVFADALSFIKKRFPNGESK